MTKGEPGSNATRTRLKSNSWRDEEVLYLNGLGADPNLNKDWDLIAQKMSDKFGTTYRSKYLPSSIKQRWLKKNPQRPRRSPSRSDADLALLADQENHESIIIRTPYHPEELAYLADLIRDFGSRDWSRVAHRMQLKFGDTYRRYAPMSLSMKWTRLRAKNQLPLPSSITGETDPNKTADMTAVATIPESRT